MLLFAATAASSRPVAVRLNLTGHVCGRLHSSWTILKEQPVGYKPPRRRQIHEESLWKVVDMRSAK